MEDPVILMLGEATGAEAAYQKFLPAALSLPVNDLVTFRADAVLAYHNTRAGYEAIKGHFADVQTRVSPAELESLHELPELALAVVFAASQIARLSRSSGEVGRKLTRARTLRRALLAGAEGAAALGLIPEAETESIRRGKGPIDTAQDCIEIAALYRRHAVSLQGKTPATADILRECAELGTELITLLKPADLAYEGPSPEETAAAVDARDRLWSLLSLRHRLLWTVGALVFGPEVRAYIPALQARLAVSKPTLEAPAA